MLDPAGGWVAGWLGGWPAVLTWHGCGQSTLSYPQKVPVLDWSHAKIHRVPHDLLGA
jgi:hypothetical protein|eukprot:COSAG06_NODE_1491_length_9280_cov_2.615075_10_plen_57_part_00